MHKDYLQQDIEPNALVVWVRGGQNQKFTPATVIGESPTQIKIQYSPYSGTVRTTRVYPKAVIVIDPILEKQNA